MRRISRLVVAAAVLGVGSSSLAQPPAAPAAPPAAAPTPAPAAAAPATADLYPLKPGSKWTYKIDEQRNVEVKVEKVENGEATLTTTAQGRKIASETVKVQPDGIYRTKINDLAITPPIKILPNPAAKDTAWDVAAKVQEQQIAGKFVIKDTKEKLKLKDGKEYECVVVEGAEFMVAGTKTKVKMWLAPGKGIVKLSYEVGQSEASLELVEYAEAKAGG